MILELTVTEQRYHAVLEVLVAGVSVTAVAERYGVSRQSVHTWPTPSHPESPQPGARSSGP